jgi:aspartate kinase
LIRLAAKRIETLKNEGDSLAVVVSAMGHTTDHLIRLAKKTVQEPPKRELDMLLTAGERVSMSLLAMSLEELGVPAISFTGSQSGILTTADHSEAKIVEVRPQRIRECLDQGKVVIIAGFQGVSNTREITTLGRGGSDTTAVALAAALKADLCEVLTDVDGIFSADPRHVPSARLLPSCSYEVALELARLGAKMHDRSMDLARRFQIPLRIRSSRNQTEGTLVHSTTPTDPSALESANVQGVATKAGFLLYRVSLPLASLSKTLHARKLSIRFFCADGDRVAFLVDVSEGTTTREALTASAISFEEVADVALVSIVGEGFSASPELLHGFLETLTASSIHPYFVITNSMSIAAVVSPLDLPSAARTLHARFLE